MLLKALFLWRYGQKACIFLGNVVPSGQPHKGFGSILSLNRKVFSMSRRRAQKQQEKEDFLDQNPELIKFETEIDVVQKFDNGMPNLMEPFGLVGSDSGGPEYEFEPGGAGGGAIDPPAAHSEYYYGPDLILSAFSDAEDVLVSLSGSGIGVFSPGDSYDGDETNQINGGETLVVQVFENNQYYPGHEGPQPAAFGEGLGINVLELEFIGTGRGTIEIGLAENYYTLAKVVESDFIRGDGETIHKFEVEIPTTYQPIPFEFADITTTGTLGVSLVGINYETNYDPGSSPYDSF
jgi:hypothetical protein